ncbi:MAG: HAD family hydrolase [Halobacteriales archaeon]
MAIEAVGFDLDYTLAVPARDRAALLDAAIAAVDGPSIDREAYLEAHRSNQAGRTETRAPIFADLLDRTDVDTDVDPETLASRYREAINEAITPVDGAESLIASLCDRYRVGLLTNGPVAAQRSKLTTLGWSTLFDAVVISGELEAGKPDGAAFRALCEALETTPDRLVYIGDEPIADIVGATDAGIRAIQIQYPDGPPIHPDAVATIDRDRLAADLPGLLDTLAG